MEMSSEVALRRRFCSKGAAILDMNEVHRANKTLSSGLSGR